MPTIARACFPVVAVAVLAAAANAQQPSGNAPAMSSGDSGQPVAGQAEAWRISLAPRGEYAFSSELESSGASVCVGRAGIGLDASGPMGDRARLLLNADLEASFYRFSDTAPPLPAAGELLRDAYTVQLRPGISYRLNDEWSVLGGAIVEFSGEPGADVGDSITYGGLVGATWRASDDLSLTFGVIVKTRLEDDAFVAPLLGIRWTIDERFSLQTEGLGVRLNARINDEFTASIFGRYEMRDFRLEDEAIVSGGIVQDTRVLIGATLEWTPSPRLRVALSGGAVVAQKFHFLNRNGDELAGDRTRIAPYVGLRAEWVF